MKNCDIFVLVSVILGYLPVLFIHSSRKNFSLRKNKIILVHLIIQSVIIFSWKLIPLEHDVINYGRLCIIGGFIMGLSIVPFIKFNLDAGFFLMVNIANYIAILMNFIDVSYGFPYIMCFFLNLSYVFLSLTNIHPKYQKKIKKQYNFLLHEICLN
jgi:hypothetical protein